MTNPSQLADLVRRTASSGTIDERADLLSFRASLGDEMLRSAWLALRREPPAFVETIGIESAGSDEELEDEREPGADEQFQIQVHKRVSADAVSLFFGTTLASLAHGLAEVSHVLVADMAENATFTSFRSRFETWTLDAPASFAASEPLPDPRSYSSDFTEKNAVPSDIRPWLLRTPPSEESSVFDTWRAIASRRLLASLADRAVLKDGVVAYGFSGPPACTVQIENSNVTDFFDRAHEGAIWVYSDGVRDADTRHLLLASEWARTFRKHGLADFGEGSLESAKGAYSAYVKAGSRETLKALADLRKSVVDETQKISQRAQDMIGAIWKDFAVASVPFVLKILPDAAKLSSSKIAGGLAVGSALFLIFSYSMQIYINHRWLAQANAAREVWKSALNLVLTKSEVTEFSDTPISTSIDDYKRVRLVVGFLYAALVAVLIIFAAINFSSVRAKPTDGDAVSGAAAGKSISPVKTQPLPAALPPETARPLPPSPSPEAQASHGSKSNAPLKMEQIDPTLRSPKN